MTVSLKDLEVQLHPKTLKARKKWLKYEYVFINPLRLQEEPSDRGLLSFKRAARLYEEIKQAYLKGEYLSTVILCGAFVDLCMYELRRVLTDIIKRKLSADSLERISEEEMIEYFERKTRKPRNADALWPSDFFMIYLMREEEIFTANKRERFLEELVRWNIILVDAKGAFNEITRFRNEHVHGLVENIVERYGRDSAKLDKYFGTWRSERKNKMLELDLFRLEWNPNYAFYPEIYKRHRDRMEKIVEKYWMLPCQTQVDYVHSIKALRRFIEGENLGILDARE